VIDVPVNLFVILITSVVNEPRTDVTDVRSNRLSVISKLVRQNVDTFRSSLHYSFGLHAWSFD
jgi:hypothetical protein